MVRTIFDIAWLLRGQFVRKTAFEWSRDDVEPWCRLLVTIGLGRCVCVRASRLAARARVAAHTQCDVRRFARIKRHSAQVYIDR